MRRIISIHAKMTTLPLLTRGKLNHKVSVEGRCANMHLWMHICTYQEDPSGLVVFMRPCFSDCSRTVPMNIQWARREWLPKAQEKREQSENVPSNSHSHKHRHKCAHAHTHNHGLTRSPAAVGGESNSDKQLRCYKGGRKSIKRDNKIAIEFL